MERGIPDPCIFDVINDFPKAGEKHFWSREGMARFKLLDDGLGCDGIITTIYQCDNSGTHKAWLEEESEGSHRVLQSFGKPNNVTLCHEGFKGGTNITDAFHSPREYLSLITMPHDVLYEPAHHTIRINSCYKHNSYTETKIYPSLEVRFTTGLSYEISSSRQIRAVKDRRDGRGKAREAMEDTKPKDKNKLRSGWTDTTAEFELFHRTSLTVELRLKVANVEYIHKYIEEIRKFRQIKQPEQMSRIDALVKSIDKYFAPNPDSRDGTRKYVLFDVKIEPVTLGVSYAYQYTDIKDGLCHFYGLYGAPFFEASSQFDTISSICAYCKMEGLVSRCREYPCRHGTSAGCYIEILPEASPDLGTVYPQEDKVQESNTKENNIELSSKGEVSAIFETNVFVMKSKSEVGVSIEAKVGFRFDRRDDGTDPVLFRDGVTSALEAGADISCGDKDRKENSGRPEKESELR